ALLGPGATGSEAAAQRAAALVQGGATVALEGDARACARAFRRGSAWVASRHRRAQARSRRSGARSEDPAIAAVQAQIEALWSEDQAARALYVESQHLDDAGWGRWARRLTF